MQPGDLRRFRDDMIGSMGPRPGSTFMVLRVNAAREWPRTVDILLDGGLEDGLGYFWVEDSSEAIDEAR